MNRADFIIDPELKELCGHSLKELTFAGRPAVKDLIESLGIPHVEVGAIVINGKNVEFSDHVIDGDSFRIQPVNWRSLSLDQYPLQPRLPARLCFSLDVHLGKLARLMRLIGLDAEWFTGQKDQELIQSALEEKRIVLTRDKDLLKHSVLKFCHWMRRTAPLDQLDEIILTFDVFDSIRPFSRCLECNGLLSPADKEVVWDELPPLVKENNGSFSRCSRCHKIYWKGTHYDRMKRMLWKRLGIKTALFEE